MIDMLHVTYIIQHLVRARGRRGEGGVRVLLWVLVFFLLGAIAGLLWRQNSVDGFLTGSRDPSLTDVPVMFLSRIPSAQEH
jgi:hypothetical protein